MKQNGKVWVIIYTILSIHRIFLVYTKYENIFKMAWTHPYINYKYLCLFQKQYLKIVHWHKLVSLLIFKNTYKNTYAKNCVGIFFFTKTKLTAYADLKGGVRTPPPSPLENSYLIHMVKLPKIVLGHSISSFAPLPPVKKPIVNASPHAYILNECFQRSSILIPPPHLHTPSLPPHSSMHVKKRVVCIFTWS